MEHQSHSNGNSTPDHQNITTSVGTPSFRVYVDMGTEQYDANGTVVYSSPQESVDSTCVDSLNDDSHYRFSCRCGCGAQFAGYGKDIKAAAKVGGNFKPVPVPAPIKTTLTTTESSDVVWVDAKPRAPDVVHAVEATVDITETAEVDHGGLEETPEKQRPYVSDRYLTKAQFGLSDDEIDLYQESRPDPLEARGVDLSRRQPPGIADLVYSLSTGEGPYSLLEYQQHDIQLETGGQIRVLCALCRTAAGNYRILPLADLAIHYAERPVVKRARRWALPLMVVLCSSAVSAAVSLAYVFLR